MRPRPRSILSVKNHRQVPHTHTPTRAHTRTHRSLLTECMCIPVTCLYKLVIFLCIFYEPKMRTVMQSCSQQCFNQILEIAAEWNDQLDADSHSKIRPRTFVCELFFLIFLCSLSYKYIYWVTDLISTSVFTDIATSIFTTLSCVHDSLFFQNYWSPQRESHLSDVG